MRFAGYDGHVYIQEISLRPASVHLIHRPTLWPDIASMVVFPCACSCAFGEAPIHYACAEKWFTERAQYRGTVICEVCKCAAKKLPEALKREIVNPKNR